MNKNAKKWVRALRSGKYKKTKYALSNGVAYCCLGVACELAVKEGIIKRRTRNANVYYGAADETLPPTVQRWLGLKTDSGNLDDKTDLTTLNDCKGYNFQKIADVIEKNAKVLFKQTK